jgi:hypothetical protein
VITSHVTVVGCRPAFVASRSVVASPSRTKALSVACRKAVREHYCFGDTVGRAGQQAECPVLFGRKTASWTYRHCTPVRLSRCDCPCQFGRASAPIMPQRVHTMRGPNIGTGT